MDGLSKSENIKMVFAGAGPATEPLQQYAKDNGITNAVFTGRYKKEEEEGIVASHHLMNAFLGRDINSDSLMSNRFYLSALMRKPLIANEGSFQAELVRKYGLGVVLTPQDNFAEAISAYWDTLDWSQYNDNCKRFLSDILIDFDIFEQQLISLWKQPTTS